MVAQFCPPPVLPKKSKKSPKLTLVLDLDETLIHVSLKQMHEDDQPIVLSNGTNDVMVTHFLPPRST
jgi:TFIIF-interacting CTD phosphatase-like protein